MRNISLLLCTRVPVYFRLTASATPWAQLSNLSHFLVWIQVLDLGPPISDFRVGVAVIGS